ncbi:hypothetical protein [Lacticaseibacillus brantae]|uniref:HicB-like antitoxin of toxin-antitoxin system domain-containing protein n=1 Tax=Lacticaseibacillus brantae DSM 23927 TaxID=1423727 RepID=A0A0R2B042_9LACO|nr:hypothetical protein [Lacticaseibacillus brantae]KRM72474.1 hypothetical protein FC34_GL000179 [Lacticaseibacillus brantae DSM 23927]
MPTTNRRYFFVAKNERTAHGYTITFVNLPHLFALGENYDETVYYAYRVLSDYLTHAPKQEAATAAYALTTLPTEVPDNVFYSLVSVTEDFDPHKMENYFTLAQRPPEEIRTNANKIANLIDPHTQLTAG